MQQPTSPELPGPRPAAGVSLCQDGCHASDLLGVEQHVQQLIEDLLPERWAEAEYAERWCWHRVGRGKNPHDYPQVLGPELRRAIELEVDSLLRRT